MLNSLMPDLGSVSVVVATYNRPDALVAALSSVTGQSYPIHEVIVVGDCCDTTTKDALETLANPRIRYINLEKRHGDQSGPNARGVNEATGDWVAFLNHDDFWFPDHIHRALTDMTKSGKKWFCGIAKFSSSVNESDGGITPVVTERGLKNRTIAKAFVSSVVYMEPVSAWVVSRAGLLAVGNWPFAEKSVRTPVAVLALALWRRLGEPVWSHKPSVLKVQGSLQLKLGGEYNSPSPVHRNIQKAIESRPGDWFKGLEEDLIDQIPRLAPLEHNFNGHSLSPLTRRGAVVARFVYRLTGFDFLSFRLERAGIRRGQFMDQLLFGRTGETRISVRSDPDNRRGRQ